MVSDLPWSEKVIRERLASYDNLANEVEQIEILLPDYKRDAYFQLVKYPVQAAAQMNRKFLKAQLARHGLAEWEESDTAFDSIVSLTCQYNSLRNGKWNLMMDMAPRRLPVFKGYSKKERLYLYGKSLYLCILLVERIIQIVLDNRDTVMDWDIVEGPLLYVRVVVFLIVWNNCLSILFD